MGVEDARRIALALTLMMANAAILIDAAPVTESTELESYDDGEGAGCYYNFQHYGEGDRIMTNEPCLNCTCHNRMLMCYLRVCPFTKPIGQDCTVEKRGDQCCPIITCPDVRVDLVDSTTISSVDSTEVGHHDNYGCSINKRFYSDGAQVPSNPEKPCELCYCIRNMTACVMQECTLHVEGCTPVYQRGVCCPVRYSCEHPEDTGPLMIEDATTTTVRPTPGFILTTTMQPGFTSECTHNDQVYADGASIRTEQACEHCYCMKGEIVCAVQECGTPMENEGKNCTAIAPKSGQCCPDTYICEGDESSTTIGPLKEVPSDSSTKEKDEPPTSQEQEEKDRVETESPQESVDEKSTSAPHITDDEKEATLSPEVHKDDYAPHVTEEEKLATESSHVPLEKQSTTISPHLPDDMKITTQSAQELEDDKVATVLPQLPEDIEAATVSHHEPEDKETTTARQVPEDKVTTISSYVPEKDEKATEPPHVFEDEKLTTILPHIPKIDEAVTDSPHILEEKPITELQSDDKEPTSSLPESDKTRATTVSSHPSEEEKDEHPATEKLQPVKSDLPSPTESTLDVATVKEDGYTTIKEHKESDEHSDEETSTRMTLDKTPQHRDDVSAEVEHVTESKLEPDSTQPTEKVPYIPSEKHETEKPKDHVDVDTTPIAEHDIVTVEPEKTDQHPIVMDHVTEITHSTEIEAHSTEAVESAEPGTTSSPKTDESSQEVEKFPDQEEIPDVHDQKPEEIPQVTSKPITPVDRTKEGEPTDISEYEPIDQHVDEGEGTEPSHVPSTVSVIHGSEKESTEPSSDKSTEKHEDLTTVQPEVTKHDEIKPETETSYEKIHDDHLSSTLAPVEHEESSGDGVLNGFQHTTAKYYDIEDGSGDTSPKSTEKPIKRVEDVSESHEIESDKKATDISSESSHEFDSGESAEDATHKPDYSDVSEPEAHPSTTSQPIQETPRPVEGEEHMIGPHLEDSDKKESDKPSDTKHVEDKTEIHGDESTHAPLDQSPTTVTPSDKTESPSSSQDEQDVFTVDDKKPVSESQKPETTEKVDFSIFDDTEKQETPEGEIHDRVSDSGEKPDVPTTDKETSTQGTTVASEPVEKTDVPEKDKDSTTKAPQAIETVAPDHEEKPGSTTLEPVIEDKPTESHDEHPQVDEDNVIEPQIITSPPKETAQTEKPDEASTVAAEDETSKHPEEVSKPTELHDKQPDDSENIVPEDTTAQHPEDTYHTEKTESHTTQAAIQIEIEDDVTTPKSQEDVTAKDHEVEQTTKYEESTTSHHINEADNEIIDTDHQYPDSHLPPRIPGEGNCLIDGKSYQNYDVIPTTNKCQTSCHCVDSVVKCEHVKCSPPPSNMKNCQAVYHTKEACCPMYTCEHEEPVIIEAGNQMSQEVDEDQPQETEATPHEVVEEPIVPSVYKPDCDSESGCEIQTKKPLDSSPVEQQTEQHEAPEVTTIPSHVPQPDEVEKKTETPHIDSEEQKPSVEVKFTTRRIVPVTPSIHDESDIEEHDSTTEKREEYESTPTTKHEEESTTQAKYPDVVAEDQHTTEVPSDSSSQKTDITSEKPQLVEEAPVTSDVDDFTVRPTFDEQKPVDVSNEGTTVRSDAEDVSDQTTIKPRVDTTTVSIDDVNRIGVSVLPTDSVDDIAPQTPDKDCEEIGCKVEAHYTRYPLDKDAESKTTTPSTPEVEKCGPHGCEDDEQNAIGSDDLEKPVCGPNGCVPESKPVDEKTKPTEVEKEQDITEKPSSPDVSISSEKPEQTKPTEVEKEQDITEKPSSPDVSISSEKPEDDKVADEVESTTQPKKDEVFEETTSAHEESVYPVPTSFPPKEDNTDEKCEGDSCSIESVTTTSAKPDAEHTEGPSDLGTQKPDSVKPSSEKPEITTIHAQYETAQPSVPETEKDITHLEQTTQPHYEVTPEEKKGETQQPESTTHDEETTISSFTTRFHIHDHTIVEVRRTTESVLSEATTSRSELKPEDKKPEPEEDAVTSFEDLAQTTVSQKDSESTSRPHAEDQGEKHDETIKPSDSESTTAKFADDKTEYEKPEQPTASEKPSDDIGIDHSTHIPYEHSTEPESHVSVETSTISKDIEESTHHKVEDQDEKTHTTPESIQEIEEEGSKKPTVDESEDHVSYEAPTTVRVLDVSKLSEPADKTEEDLSKDKIGEPEISAVTETLQEPDSETVTQKSETEKPAEDTEHDDVSSAEVSSEVETQKPDHGEAKPSYTDDKEESQPQTTEVYSPSEEEPKKPDHPVTPSSDIIDKDHDITTATILEHTEIHKDDEQVTEKIAHPAEQDEKTESSEVLDHHETTPPSTSDQEFTTVAEHRDDHTSPSGVSEDKEHTPTIIETTDKVSTETDEHDLKPDVVILDEKEYPTTEIDKQDEHTQSSTDARPTTFVFTPKAGQQTTPSSHEVASEESDENELTTSSSVKHTDVPSDVSQEDKHTTPQVSAVDDVNQFTEKPVEDEDKSIEPSEVAPTTLKSVEQDTSSSVEEMELHTEIAIISDKKKPESDDHTLDLTEKPVEPEVSVTTDGSVGDRYSDEDKEQQLPESVDSDQKIVKPTEMPAHADEHSETSPQPHAETTQVHLHSTTQSQTEISQGETTVQLHAETTTQAHVKATVPPQAETTIQPQDVGSDHEITVSPSVPDTTQAHDESTEIPKDEVIVQPQDEISSETPDQSHTTVEPSPETTLQPQKESTIQPHERTSPHPHAEITVEPQAETTAEPHIDQSDVKHTTQMQDVSHIETTVSPDYDKEEHPAQPQDGTTQSHTETTVQPHATTVQSHAETTVLPHAETTVQPHAETTEQPHTETSAHPHVKHPEQPQEQTTISSIHDEIVETTLQPHADATDQPHAETTAQPHAETTEQPHTETSAHPHVKHPEQPQEQTTISSIHDEIVETTLQPHADATDQPHAETTAQPHATTTVQPQAETTIQPHEETVAPQEEVTVQPHRESTIQPDTKSSTPSAAEETYSTERSHVESTAHPDHDESSESHEEVTPQHEGEVPVHPQEEKPVESQPDVDGHPHDETPIEPHIETTPESLAEATTQSPAETTIQPQAETTVHIVPHADSTEQPHAESTPQPAVQSTTDYIIDYITSKIPFLERSTSKPDTTSKHTTIAAEEEPEIPALPSVDEDEDQHQVHEPQLPDFPASYGSSGGDGDYDDGETFGPGTCRYGGHVYVSAQQIPRDDPCDFCFCFRSDIICLQQSCPPPIQHCREEPIQGFCCPRYECPVSMATVLNVTTTTTTTTTTLPPHFLSHAYKGQAQRRGCQIDGHVYKVGEIIKQTSGPCLHCICGADGQMKCDPKKCTPEPMLRQMIAVAATQRRRR